MVEAELARLRVRPRLRPGSRSAGVGLVDGAADGEPWSRSGSHYQSRAVAAAGAIARPPPSTATTPSPACASPPRWLTSGLSWKTPKKRPESAGPSAFLRWVKKNKDKEKKEERWRGTRSASTRAASTDTGSAGAGARDGRGRRCGASRRAGRLREGRPRPPRAQDVAGQALAGIRRSLAVKTHKRTPLIGVWYGIRASCSSVASGSGTAGFNPLHTMLRWMGLNIKSLYMFFAYTYYRGL